MRPTISYGYNTFGEPTQQRDANGVLTSITRNVHGDPTMIAGPTYTPPGGQPITPTTKTDYNTSGLPISTTDPLGHQTTYSYDLYGRPITQTDPALPGQDAGVTTVGYDRAGRTLSTVDPTGARTEATYDERGLQITSTAVDRATSPSNFVTHLGYSDAGDLTSLTTPAGNTSTAWYNAAGQPRATTDPTGLETDYTYDLAGRTVAVKSPTGVTTNTDFDLAGRPTKSTVSAPDGSPGNPAPRVTTSTYDNNDNVLSTTSPQGRVTGYSYDAGNRLTSVINHPSTGKTTTVGLGYDALDNQTRMVDGNGNATDTTYNSLGLTESVVEPTTSTFSSPSDRTWTSSYNAAGQNVRQTAPGGVATTSAYDVLGNLVSQTGSGADATAARSLTWDKDSRLVSASSPPGTITYGYNDRGLLTASSSASSGGGAAANVANAASPTTFGYDADGQLSSRIDAAGTIGFTYDKAGQLATTADPLTGRTLTYARNALGQLASVSYGTGANRTYGYNPFGDLASDTSKTTSGSTSAAVSYSYDNDDLLTGKTTSGFAGAATNTYSYDGSARLTGWNTGVVGHQLFMGRRRQPDLRRPYPLRPDQHDHRRLRRPQRAFVHVGRNQLHVHGPRHPRHRDRHRRRITDHQLHDGRLRAADLDHRQRWRSQREHDGPHVRQPRPHSDRQ
ncbi:RHS repeat domain-containing protein [Fodinicola feengrottensis]|uniref:RHS repeat domain-containing protein n=1 Tax=Fodinicola feengrottensis TaxID=435914 RepID=UPI0013D88ED9|nr:RHS repeat protein [Fodinicola feengrottensis]